MRELVGVAHGLGVELAAGVLAHGDAVAEGERPGHGECHVAVAVSLGQGSLALLLGSPLSVYHVIVYVALYVSVHAFLVVVSVVFLIVLVVLASSEPFPQLFGAEGEGEVLRHALEASEASVAVFRAVSYVWASVLVEFVCVGGEDGVHVEGIAFPPFQAEADGQVTQRPYLGCHVVGHCSSELVDDAYLAVAGSVLVASDFHLDVVGYIP